MSGLPLAVSFLTRVPMRHGDIGTDADADAAMARAVPWFGVVGALVGVATAGVYAVGRLGLPPLPAGTVAVAAAVVLTGCFHEDGLADTADAFWGGFDRDRRLAILKDSRHGSYGVAALVLGLVLRLSLVASLAPLTAAGALVAAGAIGRGAAIVLMATTPAARGSGLGASYVHALDRRQIAAGAGAVVIIAVAAMGGWGGVALLAMLVVTVAVRHIALDKIGGIVGDVLGAAEQLTELAVLLVAVVVVQRRWPHLGWWPR